MTCKTCKFRIKSNCKRFPPPFPSVSHIDPEANIDWLFNSEIKPEDIIYNDICFEYKEKNE